MLQYLEKVKGNTSNLLIIVICLKAAGGQNLNGFC